MLKRVKVNARRNRHNRKTVVDRVKSFCDTPKTVPVANYDYPRSVESKCNDADRD
jgi:hypothetical protein